jgi:hypothetical protein
MLSTKYLTEIQKSSLINTIQIQCLQGRAKIPTGGKVREPDFTQYLSGTAKIRAESVKLRYRQYSLDGRRRVRPTCLTP